MNSPSCGCACHPTAEDTSHLSTCRLCQFGGICKEPVLDRRIRVTVRYEEDVDPEELPDWYPA